MGAVRELPLTLLRSQEPATITVRCSTSCAIGSSTPAKFHLPTLRLSQNLLSTENSGVAQSVVHSIYPGSAKVAQLTITLKTHSSFLHSNTRKKPRQYLLLLTHIPNCC